MTHAVKSRYIKNCLTGFISVSAALIFFKNFITYIAVIVRMKVMSDTNTYFPYIFFFGIKYVVIIERQHYIVTDIFFGYF